MIGELVEYNLASLHCSWVCGHTASSPQVLTQLPPTVTSRASITSHVVHKPPVSTIKSSGTLHKHPTPHEYWPSSTLVWYNRQHWVSKRDHPRPNPHSNNPGLFEASKPYRTHARHNWPSLLRMDWTGTNWFMQPEGPWSNPIASSPSLIPRLVRRRIQSSK